MPFRKSGIGSVGKPDRKYFQHNYVEVVRTLTPDLYTDTDYAIYGTEDDVLYAVLGKLLKTVDEIDQIVDVDNIGKPGLMRRFIMRNNLTHLRPAIFETKILRALGTSFNAFSNKADFKKYLENYVLPEIYVNSPSQNFMKGVVRNVDASVSSVGLAKDYLLDTLSWAYILNFDRDIAETAASSVVATQLAELYDNVPLTEKEGVAMLYEYLWSNREQHPAFLQYIPPQFSLPQEEADQTYFTSGTQQLENLKTLLGVWYNKKDESSTVLDDYLQLYSIPNYTFTPRQIEGGAITKFLQAISLGFYDINTTISDLEDLVDIERCPPEFLQYLASLIGWKLLTADVDRWRAQLRKAVHLYKSKGTKRCLEDAIGLILPGISTSITTNLTENWELYLPRMIYYLIATASPVLNDGNYQEGTLAGVSGGQYFPDVMDNNYRAATDYVIRSVHESTPSSILYPLGGAIYINEDKFNLSSWDPSNPDFTGFLHRGKPNVEVPPWEDDRFYDTTYVTQPQLDIIFNILTGDRVPTNDLPGGGLEIPEDYVYALSSAILKLDVDDPVYTYQWNKKWKSYSKNLNIPPNIDRLRQVNDLKSLGVMDAWCSKSSFIFSNLQLDDLSHKVEGVSLSLPNILDNISSIFQNFVPFHVTFKIIADTVFEDSLSTIDRFCLAVDRDFYDLSTGGDSDQSILTNFITSSFTLFPGGTVTPHLNRPRTSGRRRNHKYNLEYKLFSRNGRSMPIIGLFAAASGNEPASVSGYGVNSTEFIPLGYNFSSGLFFSTSGTASGIYDASNDLAMSSLSCEFRGNTNQPGTEVYLPHCRNGRTDSSASHYGISVSSTFPCRAPLEMECGSFGVLRDNLSEISELIVNKLIGLNRISDFGEDTLNNFEFGSNIHKDFRKSNGLLVSSTYVSSTSDIVVYSEKEVKTIYSYFNELVSGKSTRVAHLVENIYSTSGGSRDSYIDNYGGSTYGTNDALYSAGSGTLYELEDD